jgi:hypothetical protein
MFWKVPEIKMRYIQWALAIGWLLLIVSLFFDPISSYLTQPETQWSPFRINNHHPFQCPVYVTEPGQSQLRVDWVGNPVGTCAPGCSRLQGKCLIDRPYAMGNRIFWTMIVAIAPGFLMIFGHEAWRRICPLSFMSQIPQALGFRSKRKVEEKSWLGRNYWYLQFGLLYVGLSMRLLFTNSDRTWLGNFLILTILAAMTVGFLFKGKTWCIYICPFSPVQKILTGPGGLLESKAHQIKPTTPITQSMCRTIDSFGDDLRACVGCKVACPDIDLEKSYWTDLKKPGRRFTQYGYLGLAIGFYVYYFLYAGDWSYYFSGDWTHEADQIGQLLNPGFYLFEQAIPIPKLIAAPLTLAVFVAVFYWLGVRLERAYSRFRKWIGKPLKPELVLHHSYSISAFLAFNVFYTFGGRPNIALLPNSLIAVFDISSLVVSTIWLLRTLTRSYEKYTRESQFSSFLAKHPKKVRPMKPEDFLFWRH